MNFLITGAAGFLGSSLANHLAREGHQVRGLDDLSTGDPQSLAPDVHFTRGDVSDRPKLWTLLQEVDVKTFGRALNTALTILGLWLLAGR